MAYKGIIYKLGDDLADNYPRVDFSRQDSSIDWLAVDEMLYADKEFDLDLIQSIDFRVITKRKRFDIVFCGGRFLFSEFAKITFTNMRLKGVRFVSTFVNGLKFNWFIFENVIDCFDRKHSDFVLFDKNSDRVMKIKKYVFSRENIYDPVLFRIKERVDIPFVTQSVVDEVKRAGLVGFRTFDIEHPPTHEMIV